MTPEEQELIDEVEIALLGGHALPVGTRIRSKTRLYYAGLILQAGHTGIITGHDSTMGDYTHFVIWDNDHMNRYVHMGAIEVMT